MKKSAKIRSKRHGIKKTQMKREAKLKKPESVKPILYTRRLKSNKQKKIKQINLPLWSNALQSCEEFDQDPSNDNELKVPSSFRDFMRRLNDWKNNKSPYRYNSNEGDTVGLQKKLPDVIPKQGKKESDESYVRRLDRCVQDERLKTSIAKKEKASLVDPETFKSAKTKKALKRLAEKKKMKKAFVFENRLTGFEHLKDHVKFGEVVNAPPVLKTKPKKVGGVSTSNGAASNTNNQITA